MTKAEQAQRNRARMPETAAVVAWFRRHFGEECRVRWAAEGGIEVGRREAPDPATTMTLDEWERWVTTGELPPGKRSPHAGHTRD